MAAGSIIVDLLMRTGSFETDTKKAERALKNLQKEAADTGKVMGAALAAGAITAAYAFDKLIKGAADFKDLEETTGASAEDLASLAIAAETAGVSMETMAGNSIRLTKSLTGVDDESKAAGAGIAALGLNLAEFKALDPVAQIDALTKAFGSFKDGPEKAAVATALWGKSGAEMLKVLKALEEQGGRTKILTQAQIDAADAYADAQAKSTAELKLYAQAAATQGAPAFLALTNAASDFIKELIGVDKETGKLAQSTAIKDFADGAVKAFAFVVDAGQVASRIFEGVGNALGGLAAVAVAVASGEFRQAKSILDEIDRKSEEISKRGFFSDKLSARLATGSPQAAAPDARPRLSFDGAEKKGKGPKKAKEEIDEVAKAIKALEEELALFGQNDTFNKAFKLEGLGATTQQVEDYRNKLAQLEELKTAAAIEEAINALVKERDELGLTSEQLTIQKLALQGASEEQIRYAQSVLGATKAAREQQAAIDEGKQIYQETRTPIEALNIELARLQDLLNRGAISWDTYSRKVFDAQDKFDATTKKAEESADSFTKKFAENAQTFLGQGLYDAMKGNYKNIGDAFVDMTTRMVAEAAAAELSRHLFGDLLKGGEGKGVFGDILKTCTSFFTDAGKEAGAGFGSEFSKGLKDVAASAGSLLSGLFSSIGGLFGGGGGFGTGSAFGNLDFGGFFAAGGDPPVGKVSVVGERGPELFIPRTAGTIVPAQATRGGGGDTFNFGGISVNSNGWMDRAAEDRAAMEIARKASALMGRRTA